MGVPCADDVMLNYQSTSYHDAASVRKVFGLRPAPEFLAWLEERGIFQGRQLAPFDPAARGHLLRNLTLALEGPDR
jgi:ethanolamine ammonia-lyase large subunit